MGQELRGSFTGQFWLEGLCWWPRDWPGSWASEGLRTVGESSFKMASSRGWQTCAGCWQEAPVLLHLDLSTSWWLGSPRVRDPRSQGESRDAFYNLASEVTNWNHHCALLAPWVIVGGDYTGCEYQEPRIPRGHQRGCLHLYHLILPSPLCFWSLHRSRLSPWTPI